MASHVPFLALRPDSQFEDVVKTRDFAAINGIVPVDAMDSAAAPYTRLGRVAPVSRLPTAVRFPLACVLSLGLSTLLYSVVAGSIGVGLAAVSRDPSDAWHVGALLAWKFAGLAVAWYSGYDYQDLASLVALSNLPYYYLLYAFYSIDGVACLGALLIDVGSMAAPFALLRPLIHAHDPARVKTANQEVAQDRNINLLLSVFGATLYSVVVYSSFYTWLPTYMVVHFDGLRSVEKAHDAGLPLLLALALPIGFATTHFIFAPAIGSTSNPGLTDPVLKPNKTLFNPETASFGQTLAWNLGYGPDGWSKRAEILTKRAAALAGCTFVNSFWRVLTTIEGTETLGAIGWAGVWGAAATLTGLAYAWVANE